jgi:cobyrinic acid a,c-diamide synthase
MALRPHLQGFGYRILEAAPGGPFPAGARFRGHAFHHAQLIRGEIARPAWIERDGAGRTGEDGALGRTWAAGFLHAYWRSNPKALRAMLGRAHAQPLDGPD